MGADRAVHVLEENTGSLDPWRTASILSEIIGDMDYDILFFGKKSLDDEMGQVGTFVGELLALPVVTAITRIEPPAAGRAQVQRALDKGDREAVTCSVPAVFTVDQKLNRPRYPTFPARKASKTAPIQQVGAATLAAAADNRMRLEQVRLAAPKLRPKKMLAPDSNLSEADQLKFIMTGGMGKKKGAAVGGDPKQIASGIIDFLREKGVVGG